MKDLCQLRTTAPRELILRLKLHATERRQRLMDLYEGALTHLLTERSTFRAQGRAVQYLLAPHKERRLYLRIPRRLARLVSSAAREDAVPPDTFAYTALFSYEVSHVFPIPKIAVTFLLHLSKQERRAMPIPPSPAERLDRARADLDNIQRLTEQLWLQPERQYDAIRELHKVLRGQELASSALMP